MGDGYDPQRDSPPTGGPASPYGMCLGLTKREWFAGHAVAGLLASGKYAMFDDCVDDALYVADRLLLKAREE